MLIKSLAKGSELSSTCILKSPTISNLDSFIVEDKKSLSPDKKKPIRARWTIYHSKVKGILVSNFKQLHLKRKKMSNFHGAAGETVLESRSKPTTPARYPRLGYKSIAIRAEFNKWRVRPAARSQSEGKKSSFLDNIKSFNKNDLLDIDRALKAPYSIR